MGDKIKQLSRLLSRLRFLVDVSGREGYKTSTHYFCRKNYRDTRKILASIIKGEMKCIG